MEVGEGERVTVRISSRSPVRAKLVDQPPSGWSVTRTDLPAALDRDDAGVRIATSRHGVELTTQRLTDVVGRVERDGMTVAFGSPGRGLPEILDLPTDSLADARPGDGEDEADAESGVEHGAPSRFDLWLNAVPNQGSEVVRTEEAMFAALACLNLKEK